MKSRSEALLLSADEKLVRVFRRVLSDLDIVMEHCTECDLAVTRLTRQRFEAVIVDCTQPVLAGRILKGTRHSVANHRAVTVAVIDPETVTGSYAPKEACEPAAHFVLLKPISLERTKSVFQAVRALMNRERRRRARIPIELPVDLRFDGNPDAIRVLSSDLGEDGMAVRFAGPKPYGSSFLVELTLPDADSTIRCRGEVAWEGGPLIGIRFCEVDSDAAHPLGRWIMHQIVGTDVDETMVRSKLTDLSLCGCYLETESPFPVNTRLSLMMRVGELELWIEGIVRVMHPETGMGVEFTQNTSGQGGRVEEFIESLLRTNGAVPDLEIRPEAIDDHKQEYMPSEQSASAKSDPLIALFLSKRDLSAELFRAELRKQRRGEVPLEV